MICSIVRKPPLSSRYSRIFLAVASPTPGSVCSCAASAVLRLIFVCGSVCSGAVSATDAASVF